LLALWAYPECLVPLSFRLHAKLAAEHDGANKWGYRKLKCGSVSTTVTGEKLAAVARSVKRKREPEPEDLEESAIRTATSSAKDGEENGTMTAKAVVEAPIEARVLDGLTEKNKLLTGEAGAITTEKKENNIQAGTAADGEQADGKEKQILGQGKEQGENGNDKEETRAEEGGKEKEKEIPSERKDWEKLPKQDEAATALLEESPLPTDLTWIDPTTVEGYAEMGTPTKTDTAQVHPFQFTTGIAALAQEAGVKIMTMTRVTKVLASKTALEGVEYVDRQTGESRTLRDVTDVVVCAGPWTGKLLPRAKVEGLRAHSVVWEADVSPYAVFTDIDLPAEYIPEHRARMGQKKRHRGRVDPEIYARPFGEVYACGRLSSLMVQTSNSRP
jgi:hypothetical protein